MNRIEKHLTKSVQSYNISAFGFLNYFSSAFRLWLLFVHFSVLFLSAIHSATAVFLKIELCMNAFTHRLIVRLLLYIYFIYAETFVRSRWSFIPAYYIVGLKINRHYALIYCLLCSHFLLFSSFGCCYSRVR